MKQPTCFMKNQTPSLIYVILTNSNSLLCNSLNFNCGLSDCHHIITTSLKETCTNVDNKKVTFRSYKNFDEAEFNEELSRVPFHIAHIFNDMGDIYWAHETLLREVLDEQAPLKQKKKKKKTKKKQQLKFSHLQYMNSHYRNIIYKQDKPETIITEIKPVKTGKYIQNGGTLKQKQKESQFLSTFRKGVVGDPSPRTFGQPSSLSCLRSQP